MIKKIVFIGCILTLCLSNYICALPAFPGAEGFGAEATGGRGGVVVIVDRLDDPIPAESGTLRYALETVTQPRIVVFKVGGAIRLNAFITAAPNVTIAGQTAPGDGITVVGHIGLNDNSIMRYIRIRQAEVGWADCLEIIGTNIIIDHCSFSWANDENIGFKRNDDNPRDRNVTIQWSVLSEAEKGVLAWYAHNVSFYHNIFAHNYTRNPVYAADIFPHVMDFRNNIVYDVGEFACGVKGWVNVNVANNYFKVGNPTRLHVYCVVIEDSTSLLESKVYVEGNSGPRTREGAAQWEEVRFSWYVADEAIHRSFSPFPAPIVYSETDADTAYIQALEQSGASYPIRDSVDIRIVDEVFSGTNIGSYPRGPEATRAFATTQWASLVYNNGISPSDSDNDGISDEWEIQYGLDPNDPTDSGKDYNSDGYVNIEEYVNSLAQSIPQPPQPINLPPVANAGVDQVIETINTTGEYIQLDGSSSYDPEGQPLTYLWSWVIQEQQFTVNEISPKILLPCGITVLELIVNDGVNNSLVATVEIKISLINQPPSRPEVFLSPINPGTLDDIVAQATSVDPEGEVVTYTYQWYRNGELIEGTEENILSHINTSKGEIWKVLVTPCDGTIIGEVGEASVTIVNTIPTAPQIVITPTNPTDADALLVEAFGSTDVDNDLVLYLYKWVCTNSVGILIVEGNNTIPAELTSVNDIWRCYVSASDGDLQSVTVWDEVIITEIFENTPPFISEVKILPSYPTPLTDLVAYPYGWIDAEGAPPAFFWEWQKKKGKTWYNIIGENTETLSKDYLSPNTLFRVFCTPWDGIDTGITRWVEVKIKPPKK